MIIYDGLSEFNGQPVLAILTEKTSNRKTGPIGQLWMLSKKDKPVNAAKTGKDEAVCGDCPMRHCKGGACYVNIGRGPQAIWKAWKRGRYSKGKAPLGLKVRLGAYGDPAVLPYNVVKSLLDETKAKHTGYTHLWRTCDQRFRNILMASCETKEDRLEAKKMGWRTFRVVEDYDDLEDGESVCSNEMLGLQCNDCMQCSGSNGPDLVIKVHGALARRFRETVSI
jgi:hypothetical protein